MERFLLPTVSLALTNAPQTELWDATFKVAGAKEQNKCSTSGSWSSLWMFSILLMDNLMKVSCVRQEKKKKIYPLSKYFSFSISILSAWENPMKLFLRDGTDTNLFTPLGGSHRPFLTQASRKDVLREWQSRIRGQPTSQLTFQSCHTWNLEKLQTYSLKKKKRQQNWLHSHVRDSFQAEVWKQLYFTAWHSPRT